MRREDVIRKIDRGTPEALYRGKRIIVLTPDPTRTAPLPMMVEAINSVIGGACERLDFMVAVGSHRIMSEDEILELYGLSAEQRDKEFKKSSFLCHRWDQPETLVEVGRFAADEIGEMTDGKFSEELAVPINRTVMDYDLILILGPVFPHEVIGFSGGNKYLFPGISGGEFLHFFHWLAAVVTCMKTIGYKDTATLRLINRAAGFVPVPRHCISMVVAPDRSLAGLFVGPVEEAWSQAADLSSQVHIVHKERAYQTVVGAAPEMYDEIWTAGKVMYKLEQAVADGGRLVIYAPHIRTFSYTWGKYIETVGYHTSEYYLAHMDRYAGVPRGVLGHCALVKGKGTFSSGEEHPRIDVTLATGIPERECRSVNLSYMDPKRIDPQDYQGKEEDGVLFVDHAGEILHRVKG